MTRKTIPNPVQAAKNRVLPAHTTLSETQAQTLQQPTQGHTIQIKPSQNTEPPATLNNLVKTLLEPQTSLLGLKNTSPITAYEIRRTPQQIRLQYTVPTKRLERKLRTQLTNTQPEIEITDQATTGLPVQKGDTIGGGLLTPGRLDHYPLKTEFDQPPANPVTAALHRHAMQDTRFIIQTLFQPSFGQPVSRWWWKRRAYKRLSYLRKEKEKLWNNRPATPREKRQADAIEDKAGTVQFNTSIRILAIGAGKHTQSRLKEIASAFNVYENPDTGQYLDLTTITPLTETRIHQFADSIAKQRLDNWNRPFQASTRELAAFLSVPSRSQENLSYAQP